MKKMILIILAIVNSSLPAMSPSTQGNSNNELYRSLRTGQLEVASDLIARGARVNARDLHGARLLHYAVTINSLPMAQFLIEHGACIDAQDKYGRTPLDWAYQCKNQAMISLFIKNGAAHQIFINVEENKSCDAINSFLIDAAHTEDETLLFNLKTREITKRLAPEEPRDDEETNKLSQLTETPLTSMHKRPRTT